MNPYSPNETKTDEDKSLSVESLSVKTSRAFWPLLLLNLAFLLCAISVVVLPGLGSWMLVSVLIVFSIGGWTLARSLLQQ